jgi:hypothetical protein
MKDIHIQTRSIRYNFLVQQAFAQAFASLLNLKIQQLPGPCLLLSPQKLKLTTHSVFVYSKFKQTQIRVWELQHLH